jgi:hypothetical protein
MMVSPALPRPRLLWHTPDPRPARCVFSVFCFNGCRITRHCTHCPCYSFPRPHLHQRRPQRRRARHRHRRRRPRLPRRPLSLSQRLTILSSLLFPCRTQRCVPVTRCSARSHLLLTQQCTAACHRPRSIRTSSSSSGRPWRPLQGRPLTTLRSRQSPKGDATRARGSRLKIRSENTGRGQEHGVCVVLTG